MREVPVERIYREYGIPRAEQDQLALTSHQRAVAAQRSGGSLELVRPQPVVARALSLLGVDQMLAVRDSSGTGAEPEHALPGLRAAQTWWRAQN
jgi:acetyl-CoA acetyltransferase